MSRVGQAHYLEVDSPKLRFLANSMSDKGAFDIREDVSPPRLIIFVIRRSSCG